MVVRPLPWFSPSLPSQDSEFSNADQMDLYDDVLAASSQPPENRTSSSEPPPEIRQETSPKANNKAPAILYTYSGLRNKRAAVYVGSFSWVSGGLQHTCLGFLGFPGARTEVGIPLRIPQGTAAPLVWAVVPP